MLIVGHDLVSELLDGREHDLIALVRDTYVHHHHGADALPLSSFLRFPGDPANRIIALPAFVSRPIPAAGVKWISSFPGNVQFGRPRASAAILLNSLRTGHPEALIEGSLISGRRTAASAALAAELLTTGSPPTGVSLIGCGVINFEILRFLTVVFPAMASVTVHDADPERAAEFAATCRDLMPSAEVTMLRGLDDALRRHDLVSFATTSTTPHTDLSACSPGTVVLHISLRDVYPDAVFSHHNVVDDADHVCREQTSLHRAETNSGNRDFIATSIAELITGEHRAGRCRDKVTVFSPFGLGVLDIALAGFVRELAESAERGERIDNFLPGQGAQLNTR